MKLYYNQVSNSVLDIKIDKRTECFNFGSDNAYPSLIEALIRMSVTSQTCVDRSAKAVYGGSFGENGKVIVNSKGQSLNEVLRIAARQYSKHNNCYLQISYDGNHDIKAIVVVPVTEVRIGKADDKGYSGKFIVYDNWNKEKSKRIISDNFELYDKYNSDKEVIKKQIEASGKGKEVGELSDYNGQILHIRKDETYIYSLSDLNPVLSESLLESNSQTFRSKGASKGFLNTKLLTVKPFKDEPTKKAFMKELNSFRGADESNEVLVLEASQNTDDLSKEIQLDDLSGVYNDKLFEYSDKQAEKNICKAFTVPLMLVSQTDNSLFGSSGEMLKEAKIQLWETREEDRDQFEEVFSLLMSRFNDEKKITESIEIINPYEEDDEILDAKSINKKAQANLKGSVGGVTALLQTIQNVKEGLITKESAIEVVKSIYGFTDTKAKSMIGGFDEENEGVETV